MNQEFFVKLPNRPHPYGPYSCREDDDIANYLLKLSSAEEARVRGTPFRVVHPRNLSAHIQVIAYPSSTCYSYEESESVMVYGIECGPQERLSEVEIRNRLRTTYKDDVIGERCFCVYSELTQPPDEVECFQGSRKYGRGAIFTAKHYVYNSDSNSPPSGCAMPRIIGPPTNLSLHHQNSSKMGPIATNSDPHSKGPFVMSNRNLVLPASPSNNDNMRKVLTQMDAPNQALVADLPHLEQKSPLQNLGDLAGSTALQSVLVTPSGEQPELGGPVPCKEDKSPVIIINVTDEEENVEKHTKEEIVKPQSESSVGVSSPKSTVDGLFKSLVSLRRQRSLSGCEDMVAPKLQKSHSGMVTGRTLSLPPNEQLSKSTENLCTGSSTGLLRSQNDLSTMVHRNKDDFNLLLDCSAAQAHSGSSCVADVQQPKMRRRSMSDLGVQRQNSGGDLNEAVITEVGVPKSLFAQNVCPNKSRSCLASTIHEQDSENENELYKHAMQTEMSEHQRVNKASIEMPVSARRPLLRLGSQNGTSCLDDGECKSDCCDQEQEQEDEKQHSLEGEDEVVERNEVQSQPCGLHSESVLPSRAVRQQVHIMEHVYNGKCVLEDDCPRPPTAESLRQMSDIIQDHRNGMLSAPLTQLLMSYIRAHCTKCRDSGCKVPHMAVGCPQPGTSESFRSSYGSNSTTLSQPSYQLVVQHPEQSPYQDQPNHLTQQLHCSISFDMIAANLSTSDDMKEFNLLRGSDQCVESRYPVGQHGANYTDDSVGGGFPPTNGTPPDVANPMVCAPPDYRPRPNGLPGVGQGQAMAPVAATTNEKGLTPWQSTGFLPLKMFCNSSRGPIQQVSDFDYVGGLNRHQACYIQPTRKVNNYIQDHSPFSPSELPDVLEEGFPSGRKYSNIDEGVLIYCSKKLTNDTGFSLGAKGRPPNQDKADVLGKGGNGQVYGYFQNGREFAIKRTTYRQTELQAWLKLDHPNVLPLLGVMWGGHNSHRGHYCYQFMTKMTSDLSSVMRSVGDLCTLIHSESSNHWENVLRPNVCHVLRSVVSGVKYLHDMGIQHYDLKASNILINKPSYCQCTNIFCCECPSESKCEIRITDFDSVKRFTPGRCAASVPDVECVPKPSDIKVLGTPFYRAPEQFKLQKCSTGAVQSTTWSQQQYNVEGLEGPWCDMWAVGVIITQLCLGKQRTEEREKVCRTMVTTPTTIPSTPNPTPEVEGFVARERLSTLREKCMSCHQLVPLSDIAAWCLEPDFKKRITAEKLLQNDFLR